jgi:hypothetical protein
VQAAGRRGTSANGGDRRREAVGLVGETRSWVSGLGSARGEHLRAARELAKLLEAAAAAERR